MDAIDRKIAALVQQNSRLSNAEIASAVGLSVSTANDRLRRLASGGVIRSWRAQLDPGAVGSGLCAFMFVDMHFEAERAAVQALSARPEVQELHHISGAHSYMMKVRVADTAALQRFMNEEVKPLAAVHRTESFIVLDTAKETTAVGVIDPETGRPVP